MQQTQAQRAQKMNPSVIREISKVTEKPGIISFASGFPSPQTFPIEAFALHLHGLVWQNIGAVFAAGLSGGTESALPQAAAGQTGG